MPLTEGDRSIIRLMITEAITEYGKMQEARHNQNLQKFDEIKETINQVKNIRGLIAWGIPLLVAMASAVAEFMRFIK